MNTSFKLTLLVAASLMLRIPGQAATINMNASDGVGTSSFNTGLHWVGGLPPSGANDYNTAGFFMRTPGDNVTNYVFGGGSLTLGPVNTAGGVNGSILEKFGPGAGSVRWLTINNFTNGPSAMIRSGGTAGALIHVQGNHFTVAGNSSILADQCIWIMDAPMLGGDSVVLTNFANNANDHISYTTNNSGFTGTWHLTGAGTTAWTIQLEALNSLPGNPSSFNPGQLTFLGGGQLRDIIGCTYNNSNGGITLAANGTINTSVTTLIGVPITDLTNGVHSLSALLSTGAGTLILSNANNNYAGGTTISAGVLQLGVDNAIPGNTVGGNVNATGTLDLNGHNATINGLNGSGFVDTVAGGTPKLTVGANGNNGTFSGTIQNSVGTLSLTKVGAGTQTMSGGYTYSGATTVAGGTLSLNTTLGIVPSTPGDLVVSNGAVLAVNVSSGNPLPANNLVVGTNSTLSLTLNPAANGINAAGNLTLQDNATNTFNYGTITANPTAPAINVAGGISAPGSTIVINISALGLQSGTITLIKYTGPALGNIANFQLNLPVGVVAALVNNTGNDSIDLLITTGNQNVAWNGVNGNTWDTSTVNWTNIGVGGLTVFRQGDGVVFDDTLTNDFVNPPPTNINLTAEFSTYPIPGLVVNSTLPYSFSGAGGITGTTSLIKSNVGSLTLLTSNSFTGGVFIQGGSVVINNDSALGASSGGVTISAATLQMNGGVTNTRAISMPNFSIIGVGAGISAALGGTISGGGSSLNKSDTGTLILTARETFTGNLFIHGGTVVIDTGGSITNGSFHDVGQNGADAGTLTLRGTGSLLTTSDFNVGDVDSSTGTLNIQDTATLTVNQFFVGSANAGGSTASGVVNQSGGTITEISAAVGALAIGGRNSVSGVGVYNMNGGVLTANSGIRVGGTGVGTLNQNGGVINALGGINIARIAGSYGTNNLNGGTLVTLNVATSTGTNAAFNFNGGTLQAAFNPPNPWFSGVIQTKVLAGGAIIDSSTNNVTITTPLLAGSPNGGLTKKGSGTLTLTGTNTFTGPITNTAGTLFLNSTSTYAGAVVVNAGTLQLTTASTIRGDTTVNSNAVLSINQLGSALLNVSNLTFNGGVGVPGATIGLAITTGNNPNVALVNCGTLTLNGTNTVSLVAANVGTLALIKYVGAISGSGNLTNLNLPQGATGFISNSAANSTLYAVITSTGPGLVWTGTNSAALNLWDINATTNWLVGPSPTSYHQIIIPGDAVTFNDVGSGTVILNTNVSPLSVVISNNTKSYTFSGSSRISGATGLLKLGSNTAILSISNNNYLGDTIVSNGTLQVGRAAAISPTANVNIGSSGTLQLAGFTLTAGELTGSGLVDNNSGSDLVLTVGTSGGGTWNGSIQDHGGGAVALTKNGSGTWIVGGSNRLANGTAFTIQNIFNGGTTIITNGGSMIVPTLQTWVANGGGNTATMIVDGGLLAVSNNILTIGNGAGANGTLVVNNGTVIHGGNPNNAFGNPNNIFIGGQGGTGTLTVNGGQVINSQVLAIGENAGANGTFRLNGGLVQTTQIRPNGATPNSSIAYFNGGTLRAATNSADFITSGTTALIQSGGLVLDDGGFAVSMSSQIFAEDPLSTGGGLIKKGSGTLYLDQGNNYTGTTVVTNGTLAGIGSVVSPVVVAPAGNLMAGDAVNTGGMLTINNTLTIQGSATLRINKNGGFPVSDLVAGITTANYGGTLVVTNTTSDSTALVAGDTFTLFSAGAFTGNFTSISGSAGTGLAYSFNPSSGVLSVITHNVFDDPTPILFSVSGSSLTLSWAADHTGWILQSQTNSLSVGLTTTWFDIVGSSSGNSVTVPLSPGNPSVFFRLRHP